MWNGVPGSTLRGSNFEPPMSLLGHSLPIADVRSFSPPVADISQRHSKRSDGPKNEPARAGARCARNGASGEARANRLIERC